MVTTLKLFVPSFVENRSGVNLYVYKFDPITHFSRSFHMSDTQRWFTTLVVLLLACGASNHVDAQERLKAQSWEVADRWTNHIGLRRSLEAAGFETRAFDPENGLEKNCDVLVLGSFLSEDATYRAWAKSQAKALDRFLARGGVVLQMTQADQTESTPAFLPGKLKIKRTDKDAASVLVLADSHPLVANLPRRSSSKKQLELPMHHRQGSWESQRDQKGFRVLLALDATHRDPVLVEAEVGKGRLLMTSLFFDKLDDASGKTVAPKVFAMHLKCSLLAFMTTSLRFETVTGQMSNRRPPTFHQLHGHSFLVQSRWLFYLIPKSIANATPNTFWLRPSGSLTTENG